jgi:hypothetical protein
MFDPKSYELAEYFLPGATTERLKTALAQAIQDAIENWVAGERDRMTHIIEPPDLPRGPC